MTATDYWVRALKQPGKVAAGMVACFWLLGLHWITVALAAFLVLVWGPRGSWIAVLWLCVLPKLVWDVAEHGYPISWALMLHVPWLPVCLLAGLYHMTRNLALSLEGMSVLWVAVLWMGGWLLDAHEVQLWLGRVASHMLAMDPVPEVPLWVAQSWPVWLQLRWLCFVVLASWMAWWLELNPSYVRGLGALRLSRVYSVLSLVGVIAACSVGDMAHPVVTVAFAWGGVLAMVGGVRLYGVLSSRVGARSGALRVGMLLAYAAVVVSAGFMVWLVLWCWGVLDALSDRVHQASKVASDV